MSELLRLRAGQRRKAIVKITDLALPVGVKNPRYWPCAWRAVISRDTQAVRIGMCEYASQTESQRASPLECGADRRSSKISGNLQRGCILVAVAGPLNDLNRFFQNLKNAMKMPGR